nr:methylmalonyl Co-A mutase-associated GTPase MeaB [Caldalkalibacillus salinus]
MDALIQRLLKGDVRALARAISHIENDHPSRLQLLEALHPYKDRAIKVGITGAPGAGKSSLVNRLIHLLRQQGLSVGIIAVDPTSPFTGGALLGDRVRMSQHYVDPQVFIRSMSTRGSLGGLARATKEAVHAVDAFGKDVILIETVGVGQTELDIMNVADTTMVVLTPNGGDTVQAFKAGIMEIADVYVINKADIPGASKLVAEIEHMLDLVKHDHTWRPPIVQSVSTKNEGVAELWDEVQAHQNYLRSSGEGEKRKQDRLVREVHETIQHQLSLFMRERLAEDEMKRMLQQARNGKNNPYHIATALFKQWFSSDDGPARETEQTIRE